MRAPVDVIIPVYNEGAGILRTLKALADKVRTPIRILICYDREDDTSLSAIRSEESVGLELKFVRNEGHGAHGAVVTGMRKSESDMVVVYMADDDYNAGIVDRMIAEGRAGADVVCASRFMPGGSMSGCPLLKAILVRVASFTLHWLARLPARDATNAFRLFSRRLLQRVRLESSEGFTFSLELLAKCHRLGWRITEVPAAWFERTQGSSRFRVLRWIPAYLHWYAYVFATTCLRRGVGSVY